MKMVPSLDLYENAACKGMDIGLFFPDRGVAYKCIIDTKKICKSCPVRLECFEVGMAQEQDHFGIFGGTTPRERRKIRAERANGNPDFFYASCISDNESAEALDVDFEAEKDVA